ncbi:MAG: phosphoribosylaminoimidazolesuccinocarboxamide synthase [Isosphaeraceae bacterium]|nr:phosphoribosylaminoimidazolesuccinocarboxamide synthase [Isosphaeraceae bacterium]
MPLIDLEIPGLPRRSGKVREVFDLGDRLLMVATDRISAFDWILPTPIPDKGRVLTGLTGFWLSRLDVVNHLISFDIDDARLDLPQALRDELVGRSMIVRKARVIPYECVVRGYLAGSGWKEYARSGTVCSEPLVEGLLESSEIDPPIFTPATKAETGHDENVSFDQMASSVGGELADELRSASLEIYASASRIARDRGIILADTKFEWGLDERTGELLLIDEVLTPDSSRYWSLERYEPGGPQPSYDKQYVRDWLESTSWDKSSPPPPLPDDVVARTRTKYVDAFEILTGTRFPWG